MGRKFGLFGISRKSEEIFECNFGLSGR